LGRGDAPLSRPSDPGRAGAAVLCQGFPPPSACPDLRWVDGLGAGVWGLVLSSGAGPGVRATTHARRRASTVPAPVNPSGSRTRTPHDRRLWSTTGGGRTERQGGPPWQSSPCASCLKLASTSGLRPSAGDPA